jgi:hypothetical protein
MNWNPFSRRKLQTLNDDEKINFAKTIADVLEIQLMLVSDRATIRSENGGPKPKSIGYVYGCGDAVLRSRGWSMSDAEVGPPVTFHVLRTLWPGKEADYYDFLVDNLSHNAVNAGMLRGGQEVTDWLKGRMSGGGPTGLAQLILTEK